MESLKSRLDIVEVLSGYLTLKRAGRNFKALCPFHNEKTPSFMVSPDRQVFHCFGCGAGGDVLAFVMKYESLGFSEAVRSLAERAGLDPEDFLTPQKGMRDKNKKEKEKTHDRKDLLAVIKEAADFYAQNLGHFPAAQGYLEKRGVDAASIRRFGLGYAPPGWGALSAHLKGKGFDEDMIAASGICRKRETGGLYDMLRDRVIFPIRDTGGKTIAFGGRIMGANHGSGDGAGGEAAQPKYLNTADSIVFKKGETLYGLDLARDTLHKKGYLVLCEGYLDVIICHQYGFENAAAPLGTAFGAFHLRRLKRHTDRLLFVFDGDQAGLSAAVRAVGLALEQDFRVKVALLPAGADPDSFLREKGTLAFKKILGASLTPVGFALRTAKGKVEAVREAIWFLHHVPDAVAREEFIRELAEAAKISESALRREIARQESGGGGRIAGGSGPGGNAEFRYNEETKLLSVFVNLPEKREKIFLETDGLRMMRDPLVKGLIFRLKEGESPGSGAFSDEEQSLLARVQVMPGFSPDEADRTIEGCGRKLRLRQVEKKISEAGGDLNLKKKLFRDREAIKGGDRANGKGI